MKFVSDTDFRLPLCVNPTGSAELSAVSFPKFGNALSAMIGDNAPPSIDFRVEE
jgi:hypothetical protein